MKNSGIFVLFTVLMLFLQGCFITSFFPIYTEDTTVFTDELLGAWEDTEGDSGVWTFTKGDDDNYRLHISGMDNQRRTVDTLDAYLVQLDGLYFLDLHPASFPGGYEGLLEGFFAPVHVFLKLAWEEDRLTLYFPEQDDIKKGIEKGEIELSVLENEYYNMISSSTAELQEFLRRHGSDDSLFDEGALLIKR